MLPRNLWPSLLTTLVSGIGVAAESDPIARLEIRVVKRVYLDPTMKPFAGVGLFDLVRGKTRMDGAACPEKSNGAGSVSCQVKCKADEKDLITIRVLPPTNQDHLAGWVTPPPIDVELRGCVLTPATITARYEDARYALNNTILQINLASLGPGDVSVRGVRGGDTVWKDILSKPQPVFWRVSVAAKTTQGRKALFEILRYSNEGAKAYNVSPSKLTPSELAEKRALSEWETLTKNALLLSQFGRAIPPSQRSRTQLLLTSDRLGYLSNLKELDQALDDLKSKTPGQQKLSDDVKALRSLPSSGNEAKRSLQILEQWK